MGADDSAHRVAMGVPRVVRPRRTSAGRDGKTARVFRVNQGLQNVRRGKHATRDTPTLLLTVDDLSCFAVCGGRRMTDLRR